MTNNDLHFMRHALRLAARGLGQTWPNPSVGAVIVKNGAIVGRCVTARDGRPHAETQAIAMAGEDAKGATLYVTLEPCAHQGKTPPCTVSIIANGIARVVSACTDSNPLVAGKGFDQLRKAGIEVIEGVCESEARALNEGFFSLIERKRPFVTVKIASSSDGKIAGGKERWITNELSRARGHLLRATHDAILTGIGTVLADDPELTCRLPGREEDSPQRVVLDSKLRTPVTAKILPAWIFTGEKKNTALEEAGATIFTVPLQKKQLPLKAVLETLGEKGVTRLMVEAGSALTSAFIREGLADRIYWFRAPEIIAAKGLNALEKADLGGFSLQITECIGDDALEIYEPK